MKRPRSNFFVNSQAPCPLRQVTFIKSPRRPQKKARHHEDRASTSPAREERGSQSLSSCRYGRSPAKLAAAWNWNHRRSRTSSTRPSASASTRTGFPLPRSIFDQAGLLRHGSGRTRRLFRRRVRHRGSWTRAATWTGTKHGAAGSPSSFALASRRHAKIRRGPIPCLRATSDTFPPAAKRLGDDPRLFIRGPMAPSLATAQNLNRIDQMTSSHIQGHKLPRSRPENKRSLPDGHRRSGQRLAAPAKMQRSAPRPRAQSGLPGSACSGSSPPK